MFTIKAVSEGQTSVSERIKLFSAERVLVAPADAPCRITEGVKPINGGAELRVQLMDDKDVVFDCIDVGHGFFNWNKVYVLNERGRTVQTIEPRSPHPESTGMKSAA